MKKILKKSLPYVFLTLLVLIILQLLMKIFSVDLTIPFSFQKDQLYTYMICKMVVANSYHLFTIPQCHLLGAPDYNIMADFPLFDWNLMFIFMKALSPFCKNYSSILHVYYILTYLLVAYSSYYVFRKFRINNFVSISASLIFTFAPYHFLRNTTHLAYSSYYFIPLMILIVFWIWSKKPIFFKYRDNKWQIDFCNCKSIFALSVAILSGISCIYFNYFWMFFLTVAAISAWYYRKNIYNVISYLIIALTNFFIIVLNSLPYIIYKIQHGVNPEVAHRFPFEAEYYGLKIVQMILPIDNHFLLAKWKECYNTTPLTLTESSLATLGIIATIGFLFILFYFLFIRGKDFDILKKCGTLLTAGILLATVGGFSSFISFAIYSQIRCYNRISIFLAFISILVFAILLQKGLKKIKNKYVAIIALILITGIGIKDAAPRRLSYTHMYKQNKIYYNATKEFIKTLEDMNEDNAMIFQLPYIPFPEYPTVGQLFDYEHFKPYIISDNDKLRWSYGAMKGRDTANWNRETSELPIPQMVKRLKEKGFAGILLNKKGYINGPGSAVVVDENYPNELTKFFGKPDAENYEYIYYSLK